MSTVKSCGLCGLPPSGIVSSLISDNPGNAKNKVAESRLYTVSEAGSLLLFHFEYFLPFSKTEAPSFLRFFFNLMRTNFFVPSSCKMEFLPVKLFLYYSYNGPEIIVLSLTKFQVPTIKKKLRTNNMKNGTFTIFKIIRSFEFKDEWVIFKIQYFHNHGVFWIFLSDMETNEFFKVTSHWRTFFLKEVIIRMYFEKMGLGPSDFFDFVRL